MTRARAQGWWWSLGVAGFALGCGTDAGTGSGVDSGAMALDAGADTGPADTGPADTGPADTGPADTGPMLGEYPEGPYGNRRGDTIANLAWEGYVNPTGQGLSSEQTYGPTSMQALRPLGRFALVHVSEFF